MKKKFIAYFLIFITFFNLTFVNYKKVDVIAGDIVVIGGVAYGVKEITEIILGLMAVSGGAYFVDKNIDNIDNACAKTCESYFDYLEDKKDITHYSADLYSEWLSSASSVIKSGVSSGVNKTVNVSTDLYNSFKSFLNEVFNDDVSVDDSIILPTFNTKIHFNAISSLVPDDDIYLTRVKSNPDTYKLFSFEFYYNGTLNYSCFGATPYMYYNERQLAPKKLVNVTSSPYTDKYSKLTYTFSCYLYDNPALGEYFYPYSIYVDNDNPNVDLYLFGLESDLGSIPIENNDIPSWRKPLELDDIKLKSLSGDNLFDNYDVISKDSLVDDGVVVGDRSLSFPNVGVLEGLYEKWLNGELSYNDYINAVNKALGVIGVDNAADDVIVTDTGISLPLDTPIWNDRDKSVDDNPTKVKDVISSSSSSIGGDLVAFPDLTEIFPFCIPFDLIRIIKLLVTEPETPHFEIPIKYDKLGLDYNLIIDFAQFEFASKICRTFLSIIFIISLILLTRRLIKG